MMQTAQPKLNIKQGQAVQKQYADQTRQCRSFKVNDMVYLTTKNIKQQPGVSELKPVARDPPCGRSLHYSIKSVDANAVSVMR